MEKQNNQWYFSWPVIIIAFIVFWPIGLVLLFLRNRDNKQAVFLGSTSKKKYIIAGIILIVIGIGMYGNSTFWSISLIVGGIALIVYAEKLTKRAQRNKTYIDLIANQGETSLDRISSICNIQYDTVIKELRQLISVGVLKNATIDEINRSIEINKSQLEQNSNSGSVFMDSIVNDDSFAPDNIVTVSCGGCGAKVAVRQGSTVTCEYCDSPISAN